MSVPLHTQRHRADSFGSVAQRYDTYRPHYPQEMIDDLAALEPTTVLDVGSGTGILAGQLSDLGVDLLAVEPDAAMADVARGKEIDVEQATFEDWDAEQRTFDLIVFGTSWHWVDADVGVPKAHSLLTPSGHLALAWNHPVAVDPSQQAFEDFWSEYMDPAAPSPDGDATELVESLRSNGFHVTAREYSWHTEYSTDDYIELVFTYSSHITIDRASQHELRSELADFIGPTGVAIDGRTDCIIAQRN